ncbi:MAG: nucleotide-binding protein [Thermoanaerobaculia bacterium]
MRFTISLLAAVLLVGCAEKEAPVSEMAQPVSAARSHVQPETATLHSAPVANGGAAAAEVETGTITGKVLETMDSAGYTYLRLKTATGESWAAVREAKVSVGQQAIVINAMEMHGFESKTLNRKFDSIYFGSLPLERGSAAGAAAPAAKQEMRSQAMAAQHAVTAKGPAEAGDVKVPKAQGADAHTIAEIYAKKTQLKDKPVTVRGKVVKSNSGIMGKNWIHIRDGSGSAATKDDDLTVTMNASAALGDVVVVHGTVHVDRDFGAGYAYAVIVEDASITK